MTDSKPFLSITTRNIYSFKARLMVNVASVREACNKHIISDIPLIGRSYDVDDEFITIMHCSLLDNCMKTESGHYPIRLYVIEAKPSLN